MSTEKMFINPDQNAMDSKKSTLRKQEYLLSNLKYNLIGELRKHGAIKISVDGFEKKDDTYKVKAKFILDTYKQGEFTFKANNFGNYLIKGFDLSIDNATPVVAELVVPVQIEPEHMVFDLSLIQAKQVGKNEFEVIYPTIGTLGIMSNANLDIETVKKLCAMAGEAYGIKPDFANEFKVTIVSNDDLPIGDSPDKMFEAQKDIKSYVKSNTNDKEKNQFVTLRNNFVKSIELKAQNIVKQSQTSYSKGSPKIISVESVLEYINNKFDGSIIVKAQIGNDLIHYSLPVVKNNICVKGNIETYKLKREDFINDLNKKINEQIKSSYEVDLQIAQANEIQMQKEAKDIQEKILGYKVSDVQKSFKVNKEFLREGVQTGEEVNLNGNIYKVEFEEGGCVANLVLVPAK